MKQTGTSQKSALPALPKYPSLYQLNTRLLLAEGKFKTLDQLPDSFFAQLHQQGFDFLYLLGIWQTGTEGMQVSQCHPTFEKEFQQVLPDVTEEDIVGSPFAVCAYTVHQQYGDQSSLQRFRQKLHQRGIRLILDFIPNHVALDHPWVNEHPEYFIHGDEILLRSDPSNWVTVTSNGKTLILAHGRDPYFPGWPDTLQLNYRHPEVRAVMVNELARISNLCDGVRCDMSMLLVPRVFQSTWGKYTTPRGYKPSDDNFWGPTIALIKKQHPEFTFMAEVYWDMEYELQREGFDYTYDKKLYDRLKTFHANEVIHHLWAAPDFQKHSVRFLENHDESRAASVFPLHIHKAAAVIMSCIPGMRFFHDGQFTGRKVKASIHLKRRKLEEPDRDISTFYNRLLSVVLHEPLFKDGEWRLLECTPAWDGNISKHNFIAMIWYFPHPTTGSSTSSVFLVVVNYSQWKSQCFVDLHGDFWPPALAESTHCLLTDQFSDTKYVRQFQELTTRGLYLDIPEYAFHLFRITPTIAATDKE